MTAATIHGHGPRCPCDFCSWRARRATAAYWIARGVRRLAGLDPFQERSN